MCAAVDVRVPEDAGARLLPTERVAEVGTTGGLAGASHRVYVRRACVGVVVVGVGVGGGGADESRVRVAVVDVVWAYAARDGKLGRVQGALCCRVGGVRAGGRTGGRFFFSVCGCVCACVCLLACLALVLVSLCVAGAAISEPDLFQTEGGKLAVPLW